MKRKLTIGIIQQSPAMGGAETYMALLMKKFLEEGHHVLFATDNKNLLKYVDGYPMKTYSLPQILDVMGNVRGLVKSIFYLPYLTVFYINLLKTYRRQHCDVLFLSGFSEKMLVTFLTRFIPIPVVWLEHGMSDEVLRRLWSLPAHLYTLHKHIPKSIIVISEHTKNIMIQKAKLPADKVQLIYDGVQVENEIVRRTKQSKAFRIGSISRLTTEKGQQHLIRAMPMILKEVPHATLLIIGEGEDRAYFESLAEACGVSENVQFLGYVPDVKPYYKEMDIFVFPSVWELEGFGLVTAEAMSYTLPVVASKLGPIPEIVVHNETGFLVPPGDEKQLADAIITLAKNPALRKEFGEKGYERVKDHFNIRHTVRQFLTVFYEVTS